MKAPKPLEILKGGTIPLLVAFVGVAGGVIGSLVGPYLTAQHQTTKDITDRRVAVYKKFFVGQAKLLQSTSADARTKEEKDKLFNEYLQEITEARFEIGVFAGPEVIKAMVNWFQKKGSTDAKDLWKEDVKIIKRCVGKFSAKQDRLTMVTFTTCSSITAPRTSNSECLPR
jgi:tryptophan synthase beta subunit